MVGLCWSRCISGLRLCFGAALLLGAQAALALPAATDKDGGQAEGATASASAWRFKAAVAATASYGHNSRVVGVEDGGTTQLGLLFDGGATYSVRRHTWESVLAIKQQQSRTPLLDRFVKSADELALKSTYIYALKSVAWVGPYARLAGATQLFAGNLQRAEAVTVRRIDRTAAAEVIVLAPQQRLQLTKPLEPLVVRESAGAAFFPAGSNAFTLKGKTGLGLQHIVVRDGFVVADDAATPELDLQQLTATTEGGVEAELEIVGKLGKVVVWSAHANLFYPIYSSSDDDLSGIDRLSSEMAAKLSVRLASWASVDNLLSIKRLPLVLDAWQIQNSVVLTVGFDLL